MNSIHNIHLEIALLKLPYLPGANELRYVPYDLSDNTSKLLQVISEWSVATFTNMANFNLSMDK